MKSEILAHLPARISYWEYVYGVCPDKKGTLRTIAQTACWLEPKLFNLEMPENLSRVQLTCMFGEVLDKYNLSFNDLQETPASLTLFLDLDSYGASLADLGLIGYLIFNMEDNPLTELIPMAIAVLHFGLWELEHCAEYSSDYLADERYDLEATIKTKDCEDKEVQNRRTYFEDQEATLNDVDEILEMIRAHSSNVGNPIWQNEFRKKIASFAPNNETDLLWKKWLEKVAQFNMHQNENYYALFALKPDGENTCGSGACWFQTTCFIWDDSDFFIKNFTSSLDSTVNECGFENAYPVEYSMAGCRSAIRFLEVFRNYHSLINDYINITRTN